jgi:hypothetical protein
MSMTYTPTSDDKENGAATFLSPDYGLEVIVFC